MADRDAFYAERDSIWSYWNSLTADYDSVPKALHELNIIYADFRRERDSLLFEIEHAQRVPTDFVPTVEHDSLLEQIQHLESEMAELKGQDEQL